MQPARTGTISVSLALLGNALITCLKFFGFLVSGSSALFSETIHSLADTMNQALLLVGIRRSAKKADDEHEYGYGQERFLWALISACGIFFLGAGVTIYHGITSLFAPHTVHTTYIAFAILIVSFVIESITWVVAWRELRHAMPHADIRTALKNGDPATVAVLYEDGMAVFGVVIALISLLLTRITGFYYWDAIGSIIIGTGLAIIAVVLINKNRNFLLKKAIPEDIKETVLEILSAEPVIENVIEFKSIVLDMGVYLVKCEIEFNGSYLLKELQSELRDDFDDIDGDYEEFKKFVVRSIDRVPRLIGQHINRIEAKIQTRFPEIHYIDIEIN